MQARLYFLPLIALFFNAAAETTVADIKACPEKAGGIYYAYPVSESMNTNPPKGYEPFYISHYGRHGSRYLISDQDYTNVISLFDKASEAGALTPLGEDINKRLKSIWPEAEGRGGELTPLGNRQHRGIARRMYNSFPEVFAGTPQLTAKSTVVMRCAHSMAAFCEGLKELNPSLEIPRESSQRNMYYLNYHSPESNHFTRHDGPWAEECRKFEETMTHPTRLTESLFADSLFILRNVNPHDLMWGLYWIAVDMQNMETDVKFTDIFTPDELFDLWRAFSYRFYVTNSNHPASEGMLLDNAKPLLRNILEGAQQAIDGHKNGADFRFGHDGNLIPLAGLMRLEGCYGSEANPYEVCKIYDDYMISPMAGNIQMILLRNKSGNVIVKFMLNEREISIPIETDMAPFYKWNDVREFFTGILDGTQETTF